MCHVELALFSWQQVFEETQVIYAINQQVHIFNSPVNAINQLRIALINRLIIQLVS